MNFESEKLIYNIHSAFLLEFTQAAACLTQFREAVDSFFLQIITKNEADPNSELLEADITSIQDICFFLKTFCAETELHTQLLQSKNKDETSADIIEEQMDIEYKLPENPNEVYPFELYPEIFTYETIDPEKYAVGQEEEFFVSYIKDDTSFLFFLMKASCLEIIIKQPEFLYDIIPSKGTVFGLLVDGVIVRAVRENSLKKQPKSFKVFLIDFGEMMVITKDFKMFRLPEGMQQIPGQAIFCKLSDCPDDNDECNDENFLQEKLHTKQRVRIDKVYKNMLEVTFMPPLPPVMTTTPTTSTIPKDSDLPISSNDTMPKNHETNSTSNHVNGFQSPTSSPKTGENKKRNDSLTQEELDELNDEPLNTENALEAVMGYIPTDDKRICRFTDPKTNACFKGSKCKLEHTTILKDGWTKDQKLSKMKIHSKMPLPKVGRKVNLLITYVDDLDKFYGQIISKNCKTEKDLPADQIFEKLNDPEMEAKFRKVVQPIGDFELVFALFNKEWYRARILRKLSDRLYKVFYVDYGNNADISPDDMRQWDDSFDCYPFQAMECRLDNVTKLKDRDLDAVVEFEKMVLMKPVLATVTSNVGILLVTLMDHEKFDIGEQLCAAQFAKSKPITQFASGNFPG